MKYICHAIAAAAVMQFVLMPVSVIAEQGTLTINVVGLKSDKGGVDIALMNSAEAYPDETKAYRTKYVAIKDRACTHSFTDLPYGEYAVMLYHDQNGNKTIDKNFVGKPTEPYGFSNNVRGTFAPPKYEKARFMLSQTEKTLTIEAR